MSTNSKPAAEKINLVIPVYLDLLDAQRETAFAALEALDDDLIWQRPAEKEWSIGEILDHNYLLVASSAPYIRFAWKFMFWYGKRARSKPYKNEIPDYYREPKFPMWVGFLWKPRYNPRRRIPFAQIKENLRTLHSDIRKFYENKEEDILGNISIFDPYFGWLNLIVTLRLACYHDQLHYEDIVRLAAMLKKHG